MRLLMDSDTIENNEPQNGDQYWLPENIVEIEQHYLVFITEKICKDKKCRFPQLALRILIHVIAGLNTEGRMNICARQLSKAMGVNYDTVTKCLKYLREIDVLRIER